MSHKDWRGTPIERGSLVVYPVRHASALWVVEGEVEDIVTRKEWWGARGEIDVTELKVRRKRSTEWGGDKIKERIVTVGADRVTVIR